MQMTKPATSITSVTSVPSITSAFLFLHPLPPSSPPSFLPSLLPLPPRRHKHTKSVPVSINLWNPAVSDGGADASRLAALMSGGGSDAGDMRQRWRPRPTYGSSKMMLLDSRRLKGSLKASLRPGTFCWATDEAGITSRIAQAEIRILIFWPRSGWLLSSIANENELKFNEAWII